MIRHFVNFLLALLPPSRCFALRYLLLRWAGLELERNVKFCGRGWIFGRGRLLIGEATWLSPGVIVHTHVDADITIGSRCDVGPGVEFMTGSHEIGSAARRAGEGTAFPIRVGDGCWIGARALILGGVSIGAGSIIAAGSVVTHNVPPNTLAAGVPASVKRQLT
ncbi:MAG: DapH/DapD/GlmU-related protein [Polaromonas sp.]